MSSESKLFQEVAADPTSDLPRMVMADWYEENGDSPRAELIRAQCEMARLEWDEPRYVELEDVVDQLIPKHRAKWIKKLPKLPGITWGNYDSAMAQSVWDKGRQYFHRGFVELIAIKDFPSYKKNLAALKKYGLGSFVSLVDQNHRSFAQLAKSEYVKGVEFSQCPIDFDWFESLENPHLLEAITVSESDLDSEGVERLLELDLPGLRSIELTASGVENQLKKLLSWSSLNGVRWLEMGLNDLGRGNNIELLAKQKSLQNLSALNLWSNELTPKHVLSFVKHSKMKRLVFLSLARNDINDAGIKALLTGKWKSLRFLNLAHINMGNAGVFALAASKQLNGLKHLNLGENKRITDVGLCAIAESKSLGSLTHLNLAKIEIGEKAAEAFIESTTLNSMRYLNIGKPDLKPATIKALKKRFPRAIVEKPFH